MENYNKGIGSHMKSEVKNGLFSIEERLDHLGEHFEIESKPGCGTRAIMVALLKDEK
jgi:signal transduction histidine kinase